MMLFPAGLGGEGDESRRARALVVLFVFAAALAIAGPAVAGSAPRAATPEPAAGAPPAPSNPPKSGHEQTSRRMTKFEARKIRHVCYGRANERALSGAEREAFLARCYFGRVSHRVERQQCRQQAAAQGLDKTAARDFVRECVKERVRQKEGKTAVE